jgi:tripartite ATP-independent transporter DctM subunit
LGLVALLGITLIIGFSSAMSMLVMTMFHYGTMYAFIITPLFVAMGLFSGEAGVSRGIYDTLSKWLGGLKGGLGLATVGGCTIFGTLTGASIVTALVFAKVSVPEMRRHGYDAKTAYGLVSSAGAIGMMIPPSLLAVIYALITEESIGRLLMGGIGPGIVLAICLGAGFIGLLYLRPHLGPSTQAASVTWKERFISLPRLWPAIIVAVVVIGGIYTGIFTVTEAAGIGTFILFILYLITRGFSRQSWKALGGCLRETIAISGMVLLLLTSAFLFGRFLVLSGLGPMVIDFITDMNLSAVQLVIAATVMYIALGTLMDGISILAITIPLLHPMVLAKGIDPIWFAMSMILATQIGLITPPVGLSIYAVKGVADPDISIEDIFRGVLPFFFMMIAAQAIVIAFPIISTWIPDNILG